MDQALDNLEKYANKKQKLTLIKKREYLEVMASCLREMTREDLKKRQDKMVQVLISQQVTHSGGKLMLRAIVRCLNLIFEMGDYSKVQSTLIEPLCSLIQASG